MFFIIVFLLLLCLCVKIVGVFIVVSKLDEYLMNCCFEMLELILLVVFKIVVLFKFVLFKFIVCFFFVVVYRWWCIVIIN